MSAGAVRQGRVFVEIGADPKQFFRVLNSVNRQIARLGQSVAGAGRQLGSIGSIAVAPFAAASAAGARFQDTLLQVGASTGATADQLASVKAAAMATSEALGVGPAQAAQGFLSLLKAGVGLDDVLGGLGQTAIEFAKVGDLEVSKAAEVMADAMKVFGVSAESAANALSSAADASSTSIQEMTMAFSQSSAVAALNNQTIGDLSASLAILANNGVKGSDAGTSVKTMLQRLAAPADDAIDALRQLGLSFTSFRGADGTMKPMVEIIRTLTDSLAGVNQAARDDIFRRIFGTDAIRAAAILTSTGVEGFESMQKSMDGALSVGAKYRTLMSGLSGVMQQITAATMRAAIAVSDAVAPALMDIAGPIAAVVNGITKFVQANQELVAGVARFAIGAIAAGAGLVTLGGAIGIASGTLGKLASIAAAVASPLRLLMTLASGIGQSFSSAVPGVFALVGAIGKAVASQAALVAATGKSAAAYLASVSSMAAATGSRMAFVSATWAATGIAIGAAFLAHVKAMVTYYTGALAGMQAITIARTGAMAAAWLKSLGGVDTFSASLKKTLSSSNRVVASTVSAIAPALGFVSRGFQALASDASRLAAPLAKPFVALATAAATFVADVAASVAAYASSVAAAVMATVTGTSRIAAAWVGNGLRAVQSFVSGTAAALAGYLGSVVGAVASTVTAGAGIAGAWLATAFPATAQFVAQAAAKLGTYIAAATASMVASVTSAANIAAAWVASGLPGLATFVGSAVAGLSSYVASCLGAVATTVSSAAAIAAAWLAPVAPVIAIGAALAGSIAIASRFGDQIKGALGGVGELAGQAGGAISVAFGGAVQSATIVFGDLLATAKTTFAGVYEAVADGDLSGAMDILMGGMYAGWLRGSEAIMGAVDPWISLFQDSITVMGAEIYKAFDATWTGIANSFRSVGAVLAGAMDNIINPLLAAWDTLEAGIRKSWNYVQSLFKSGFDLKAENEKVTNEMEARKRTRELERPGVDARSAQAEQDNEQARRDLKLRNQAIDENTQSTIRQREAENKRRADERRARTQSAEDAVAGMTRGKRNERTRSDQFADLLKNIESASSLSKLRELYEEFDALSSNGRLTSVQASTIEAALEDAQERVSKANSGMGAAAGRALAGAGAAGLDSSRSRAEVAGTFSAFAAGGLGQGSKLEQLAAQQVSILGRIESNTREPAVVGA